jgi:hypothetical protein
MAPAGKLLDFSFVLATIVAVGAGGDDEVLVGVDDVVFAVELYVVVVGPLSEGKSSPGFSMNEELAAKAFCVESNSVAF